MWADRIGVQAGISHHWGVEGSNALLLCLRDYSSGRRGLGEIQKGECGLAGFTYKEQYAVVVICEDEKQQEAVYHRLKEEGHKCKVVAV